MSLLLVAVALGLAEPDAVDDAGVVQFVADDRVLRAEDGLEEPAVGVEARAIEDRVLGAEESRDRRFEFLVQFWVPQMKRTLDRPSPQRARPSWAARMSAGSLANPR